MASNNAGPGGGPHIVSDAIHNAIHDAYAKLPGELLPAVNHGQEVSSVVHSLTPPDPNFGQLVSLTVLDIVATNPDSSDYPPGPPSDQLGSQVSDFVHALPVDQGNVGEAVSSFVFKIVQPGPTGAPPGPPSDQLGPQVSDFVAAFPNDPEVNHLGPAVSAFVHAALEQQPGLPQDQLHTSIFTDGLLLA